MAADPLAVICSFIFRIMTASTMGSSSAAAGAGMPSAVASPGAAFRSQPITAPGSTRS